MESSITKEELASMKSKTAMPMMWIGLVSFIMMWAGITSAYVIRQAQGDWLFFDIPATFFWSTAVIIASSLTFVLAQVFSKRGQNALTIVMLVSTFVMGIVFSMLQYQGFLELFAQGIYFTGSESNASGQYFNLIVWVHVAHVLGGLLSLLFVIIKAILGKYTPSDYLGIKLSATYWHFIGILWIYLILFLVFIR
ncbi:MAG: cytochrome c oxidase subunit 3 [Salibacteraceae bacterium]|nr:cytochrome c oxidase subunit 3 [Salibacteraceae bacterium]